MNRSMHCSRWVFHPVLASIYPVVSLFAQNYDEATVADVIPCIIASALGSFVLLAVITLLFRNWQIAGIAATFLIGCIFLHGFFSWSLTRLLNSLQLSSSNLLPNIIWLAIVLFGLVWLWRKRQNLELLANVNRMATYVTALLVGMASFSLITTATTYESGSSQSSSSAANGPSETKAGSLVIASDLIDFGVESFPAQATIPDVYFLVFDRYGGLESIKQSYDYDNAKFYDELEQRGFAIARESKSNYPKTNISMSSALNMQMLGDRVEPYSFYRDAILNHRVGRIFKELGYQYHHFGNSYGPLRRNDNADFNFPLSFLPSEFADALFEMTPFPTLINTQKKYNFVRSKMKALADLSTQEAATFAYAHFLVPHNPYAFRSDGSCASLYYRKMCDPREAYIEQLIATNAMILQLVDQIIANSATPPIIILQADEGPYLSAEDAKASKAEQIRKRAHILSAFYCPGVDMPAVFPQNISPVNTFRFVFRECFQAPIELLPNKMFFWEDVDELGLPAAEGTTMIEVTELVQ